jgi:hypothetical protein
MDWRSATWSGDYFLLDYDEIRKVENTKRLEKEANCPSSN